MGSGEGAGVDVDCGSGSCTTVKNNEDEPAMVKVWYVLGLPKLMYIPPPAALKSKRWGPSGISVKTMS